MYGKVFNFLKEKNINNWLLYTKHDFINLLSNNNLKEEYFLNYLIQDYLFLIQFSKAWSLAILKSDTLDEMKICANTVNDFVVSLKVSTSDAACSAVTKVDSAGVSVATVAIVLVGVPTSTGGIITLLST